MQCSWQEINARMFYYLKIFCRALIRTWWYWSRIGGIRMNSWFLSSMNTNIDEDLCVCQPLCCHISMHEEGR